MVHTTQVPALRLVGLALLLTLSGLAVISPAAAQTADRDLVVVGGPYFSSAPEIPARGSCSGNTVIMARPADNETQVRRIQVATLNSRSGVTRLDFNYTLAPNPGTPTNPGLSKAISWNDTLSNGAGWTVTADNSPTQAGGRRSLTFLAQPGTALNQAPPGVELTFAFQVPRTAQAGDSYPIRVNGISSTGPITTSFCIRIDTTPPKMTSAVTRDTDYDGRIDMMEVTFSEELDSDSLVHSQFDVRERGANRAYGVLSTSPDLEADDCHLEPQYDIWLYPCPRRIILKLAPGPSFDTGSKPDVTYPAPGFNGTLTDLAGNKLAPVRSGDVNTTDGAKPVMVSTLAKDGSNSIVVTFSEPVRGSGPALAGGIRPVRVDSDDPNVCQSNCGSDFVYGEGQCHPAPNTVTPTPACSTYQGAPTNACPPPAPASSQCVGDGDCLGGLDQTNRGMAPQMTGATHNPTGANANQVIIRLAGGDGGHTWRYPKAWNDAAGTIAQHGSPMTPFPPAAGARGCSNGLLGAGDTDRAKGDRLDLKREAVPPTNCLDTSRKVYDFDWENAPSDPPASRLLVDSSYPDKSVTCDRVIRDVNGLRAINYKRAPMSESALCTANCGLTITGPYVTEAQINIGGSKVDLRFNGPVTSASGNTVGIQLHDLSIVTTNCAGQGPTGILAINHTAGSDQATLTLDHPARPCDVEGTPGRSKVRVSGAPGRGIKAFGIDMLVPSYDPDGDAYPDVGLVDRTNPAFTPPNAFTPALSTIDADRNGYIDGIKVYFNEPVDDSSFCVGPVTNAVPPQVCAGDGFFDDAALNGGRACQQPNTHSILIVNNIPGPYTWDTDLLPDDNEGIIRFPETPGRLQNTGHTPAISTNPCWTKDGYDEYTPGNCITTCKRGMGLFADQYHPAPASSSPPFAVSNFMKRVCGESFQGSRDPPCDEGSGILVKVADGAPPALWSAKTLDTPVPGTPNCGPTTQTGCEGDGLLDGYVLTFSEPVNDCSLKASEWKVAGHTVTGMRTNIRLDQARAICPSPKYPPQGQGNPTLVLTFTTGSTPNTDAKPEITYAGPSCNSCGMRDLNGNSMAAFGTLAINEEDDAAPVISCARGFVGRNNVTLEFSEPVDNGDRGAIVSGNLLYGNKNQLNSDGASGLSSSVPTRHIAGERTATLTLNGPLTSKDIEQDTISAFFHAIMEVAPTVVAKKVVSTNPHKFCGGLDTRAPANVTNLQVVAGLTSANSVSLSWTAPGNDGMELGNVTGYRIKVSTLRITPADVNSPSSPGTVAILTTNHDRDPLSCPAPANGTTSTCVPECLNQVVVATQAVEFGNVLLRTDPSPCELSLPRSVQRATLIGLEPDTTYHFAVVAFDNATAPDPMDATKRVSKPNYSGMGTSVSAKTGSDSTPPTPAPVIFSIIPPYRSSTETRPEFHWSNATDPQSSVVYAYALNQQPDYAVRCAQDSQTASTSYKPATPLPLDTGKPWTFHVAACSAGGQTATAHYTIIVGAAPIDPLRIENANTLIKTQAFKLDKQYSVNWTLPEQAQIQLWVPNGEVVGVQIWRLICPEGQPCARELAVEIPGNYTTLKGPREWADNQTVFASEPYYRVEMVFSGKQTQDTSPDKVQGFTRTVDITPHKSPLVPLIFLILLAAACAAFVAWAILASKKRAAARQVQEEAPAGVDPETGLPTHDVKCPTCATPFQAVGTLPLQITCPNCGAAGILN